MKSVADNRLHKLVERLLRLFQQGTPLRFDLIDAVKPGGLNNVARVIDRSNSTAIQQPDSPPDRVIRSFPRARG